MDSPTRIERADVEAFVRSLQAQGTPWALGCEALILSLWNEAKIAREPTVLLVDEKSSVARAFARSYSQKTSWRDQVEGAMWDANHSAHHQLARDMAAILDRQLSATVIHAALLQIIEKLRYWEEQMRTMVWRSTNNDPGFMGIWMEIRDALWHYGLRFPKGGNHGL